MKAKHTRPPRRARKAKRQTAVDAAADVYWRAKLREFEDFLRRARASPPPAVIVDEIDGWFDLFEEAGIF